MSEISPAERSFSSATADELVPCRAINWWSVASLVLGLFSSLVLLTPLLSVIPLAGVLCATVALRGIATSDAPVLGRKAALWGLALALVCGVWGSTQAAIHRHFVFQDARRHAEEWLAIVQAGRLPEAFQLHLPQENRRAPGTSLDQFRQSSGDSRREYDSFFKQGPVEKLATVGTRGEVRFIAHDSLQEEILAGRFGEHVATRFALDYNDKGRPQAMPFQIVMTRRYQPASKEIQWHVREISYTHP